MKLHFTKMQGCGNDYIYFDCFEQPVENPELLGRIASDRHFGIGADGVVLVCPSQVADARMRMFNLDGSEGRMCGNAIRCVAKYLYEHGRVGTRCMRIETLSGIRTVELLGQPGEVQRARVDMGPAVLQPAALPALTTLEELVEIPLQVPAGTFYATCVSMGNPHAVIFCDSLRQIPFAEAGPQLERHPMFPQRVNVEFVQQVNATTLQMRVWERGSGETMACGTGACATVAAAVRTGRCAAGTPVQVVLRGGTLEICCTPQTVWMTGDCRTVFEGWVEWPAAAQDGPCPAPADPLLQSV